MGALAAAAVFDGVFGAHGWVWRGSGWVVTGVREGGGLAVGVVSWMDLEGGGGVGGTGWWSLWGTYDVALLRMSDGEV